jgi:D-alanyl-D-alanine dipeptidase
MRKASATLALLLAAGLPAPAAPAPPHGFVDAAGVVEGLQLEMRYHGSDNFVGRRIDGYEQPRCLLTRKAAEALARVQRELAPRGLGLKVFDCYRPVRAVRDFMRWARNLGDLKRKAEFYPDVSKRHLFRDGYIAVRSGHSRGSTVDLTLVRRADGTPLDMGTPFDFFSPKSWPRSHEVTPEQRANRVLLADVMVRGGFKPLRQEWWHFTLAGEPFPDTYFDFPVR